MPQGIPQPGQPRVINRTITRGMGAPRGSGRASLVASGFGGLRKYFEAVKRKLGDGVDYVRNNIDHIIVWAKLVNVNEEKPKHMVQGHTYVKTNKDRRISVKAVGGFSSNIRRTWENIKIIFHRIK